MALFSKKTKTAKKNTAVAVAGATSGTDYSSVLKNPRITEKATIRSAESVYVFDIAASATKRDIARAVQQIYKVSPAKVNVVTVPTKIKRNARTGKMGTKKGGRKAYVYLKKGETITIA